MKRYMLKAIVEHDAIDGILFQHPSTKRDTIRSHRNNGSRTSLGDQEWLVSRL